MSQTDKIARRLKGAFTFWRYRTFVTRASSRSRFISENNSLKAGGELTSVAKSSGDGVSAHKREIKLLNASSQQTYEAKSKSVTSRYRYIATKL